MSDTGGDYYVADFNFTLSEERSFIQIQPPPGIKLETKDNNDGTKSVYRLCSNCKSIHGRRSSE
jgi:hypothetical protein